MKKNKTSKEIVAKKRVVILLSFFLLFLISIFIYFVIFIEKKSLSENRADKINFRKTEQIITREDHDLRPRFIDGVLVEKKKHNAYPLALVLDNEPRYSPPLGISKASLVYELPSEGGSSRFLAIFYSNENIEVIGPIRSARPYFVDLALDSSALLVHCGGSPQALAQISQQRIISLNEFYNQNYFWRDKNFRAPHNIMTSSALLQKFLENNNLKDIEIDSWQFKNEENLNEDRQVKQGNILVYYSRNYQATWAYIESGNYYQRQINDEVQYDGGDKIKAKNIILHFITSRVLDDKLRLELSILGEGRAVICQLGQCRDGKWIKNNKNERLRYYYENENEVVFTPGLTWVSVISAGARVDY